MLFGPAGCLLGGAGARNFIVDSSFGRADSWTQLLSGPGHSVRQDSGCELEGSVASGCDDRRPGEDRSRGLWPLVDVLHVQPPAAILEHMLFVRLHLDNCGEENGALRVIPKSHLQGRIPENEILSIRHSSPERICEVALGGALLMRPLLLHASSPSRVPGHRRVIHLDFASVQLPSGMRWFSDHAPDLPA